MAAPTLAEKVYSLLADETSLLTGGLSALPGERLGEFEMDLRDWGMVYGIAVGIARTEDLWESLESVTERATDAAREAFKRWSGEFAEPVRSVDPLVDAILRAHLEDRGVDDAVIKLGNRIGWPKAKAVA